MNIVPKNTGENDTAVERAADVARESRERVAAAWAELVEAAKTDPKARAFLATFGMLEGPVVAAGAAVDGLALGTDDAGSDGAALERGGDARD